MTPNLETLKKNITDYTGKTESITVVETTDSAGNPCLEWQTHIILELFGAKRRGRREERLSRQNIPVQFDVSFDTAHNRVMVFLQWGRIDKVIWEKAEADVKEELARDENSAQVRYYPEREVVEVSALYPFQEFDFAFVHEEIISFFGMINGLLFRNNNQTPEAPPAP